METGILPQTEATVRRAGATAVGAILFVLSTAAFAQAKPGGDREATVPDQQSAAAEELDDEALRQRVVGLLSGYHFTPSREQLDKVAAPERVAATLRAIAADADTRPSLRGRAVDVLALYEDDQTVAFLEKLLAPPDEGLSEKARRLANDLRHRAILAYAESRSAEQAVERLAPLFELGDRQIQLTVVAALGKYTGEAGREKLAALAQRTEDDIVRDELAKYVEVDRDRNSED